jgi:CYTH domain-containing protein
MGQKMSFADQIKRLYEAFIFPLNSFKDKVKAREIIKNELESYGYKVNISVDKDNRFVSRTTLINFVRDNYNVETECEQPEYIVTAHYDSVKYARPRCVEYFTRRLNCIKYDFWRGASHSLMSFLVCALWVCLVFGIIALPIKIYGLDIPNLTWGQAFDFSLDTLILFVVGLLLLLTTGKKGQIMADDNLSGVVGLLTLAKSLKEQGITNVKFILFDNEEKGLCGSYSYLRDRDFGKEVKVINVDTIGRGSKVCLVSEKPSCFEKTVAEFLESNKIPFIKRDRSFSDCKSFSDKGYQAITLLRSDVLLYKGMKFADVSWVHSVDDMIENIDFGRLAEVVEIAIGIICKKATEEIERKFLIDRNNQIVIGLLRLARAELLEQAYLSYEPELRIRKSQDLQDLNIEAKYHLTVKSAGAVVRDEYEDEITKVEFNELLEKAISVTITKERRKIDLAGGLVAEVDLNKDVDFDIVEVEFASIEQSRNFEIPKWFGKEVTYDEDYKNKNIAKRLTERQKQGFVV